MCADAIIIVIVVNVIICICIVVITIIITWGCWLGYCTTTAHPGVRSMKLLIVSRHCNCHILVVVPVLMDHMLIMILRYRPHVDPAVQATC